MNLVLLSGGSGNRLWPLSNDVRLKQLLKDNNGQNESLIQRVYRGLEIDKNEPISTVSEFKEKLDKQIAIDMINSETLWNGGVFAGRLGDFL